MAPINLDFCGSLAPRKVHYILLFYKVSWVAISIRRYDNHTWYHIGRTDDTPSGLFSQHRKALIYKFSRFASPTPLRKFTRLIFLFALSVILALCIYAEFVQKLHHSFAVGANPDRDASPANALFGTQCTVKPPEIYTGCFTGNTAYHHTVASLASMPGFTVDKRSVNVARNFWTQTLNTINAKPGRSTQSIYVSQSNDPTYAVECPLYGTCNAATSKTGMRIHLPAGASPTSDSDHHLVAIDLASKQEIDMWGGGGGCYSDKNCLVPPGGATYTFSNGVTVPVACQVGTYIAGKLTCSWGGVFSFSGDGRATIPGNSGNAGDIAFGITGITAGELLQGHIYHALGIIGQCLDDGGVYPGNVGRSSDYTCSGEKVNGLFVPSGPEPMPRYGEMLHLKASVNLNSLPYANYSRYCRVIVKALQEYGAYHDDNSPGYGISLIELGLNDKSNADEWNAVFQSMVAGDDATGNSLFGFKFKWCLQRIDAADLESIVISSKLPERKS